MKTTCAVILSMLLGAMLARATEPYPSFPGGVVAAYLNEDAAGSGWSSETFPRLIRYAVWPDAPGWDTITVIDSFSLLDSKVSGAKATVQVKYHVLGRMENETFKSAPTVEAVTYRLERADGQWKITEPQLMPHIAVADVLRISRERTKPSTELKSSLQALEASSR